MRFLDLDDVQFHTDFDRPLVNRCGVCQVPMPTDTAFVCGRCQDRLAARLREAADNWPAVRAAVAFDVRVDPVTTWMPPRAASVGPVGPRCRGDACDHESCTTLWAAAIRNAGRVEHGAREDHGPVDWNRSETAWVVTNTVGAWAGWVAGRRGNLPEPQRRSRPASAPTARVRLERCDFSDLPVDMCGCGRHATATDVEVG